MTNPPPTSSTTLSDFVTCDTGGGGGWTFSQNVRSLALTVWERQCFEDISPKDELIDELITKLFVEQPRQHRVRQKNPCYDIFTSPAFCTPLILLALELASMYVLLSVLYLIKTLLFSIIHTCDWFKKIFCKERKLCYGCIFSMGSCVDS